MEKINQLIKTIHLSKLSFYLLIVLIILSFSITFYLLLPNNQLVKDPINLQYLLIIDVVFVIILLSIIIRQILLIFIYKRKKYDDSKLYIKFINLFTGLAVGPSIGIFIITSLFFNLEFRAWYSGAVKEAVINSNIVAQDYEKEIQDEIISDTQLILREIYKTSKNNEIQVNSIERVLNEFINLRTISNIYIFNREGEVYLSFKDKENTNFTKPNLLTFDILDKNQVYIFQQNNNSISAYKKITFLNNVFLQVNRQLNQNIWDHIENTKLAYQIYTTKEEESSGVQITFSMIKHHPFQNVYFNMLAGKEIEKKFEMDYWGLSNKQALDYILKMERLNWNFPLQKV